MQKVKEFPLNIQVDYLNNIMITIALSKGRIYTETLPLLEAANIIPAEDPEKSRKLILDTNQEDVKLVIIRATDVPTYVQFGAADIGVAGKDVLLEHGAEGLYEPVDLKIAKCKLMTAGLVDADSGRQNKNGRLRVATKFVNVAKRFFESRGEQVEVIKLYGSIELAPLIGLADMIVDVVETGATMKQNGLSVVEDIMTSSTYLIANKNSYIAKKDEVLDIYEKINSIINP